MILESLPNEKDIAIRKIDPYFDGHHEKPIKDMTPSEKLDYIWSLVEFRLIISKNAQIYNK